MNNRKENLTNKKYIGKVDHVSPRHAFVVMERRAALRQDVFVSSRDLGCAIHNDKVAIILSPQSSVNKPKGKIVSILESPMKKIVGTITVTNGLTHCDPDHRRLYPILIRPQYLNGAKENDRVIIERLKSKNRLEGKVIENFGKAGSYDAETKALLLSHEIEETFDDAIEAEVAQLPASLPEAEVKRRRDFSKVPTFTIDPTDAKDFDDALSVQTLPNGDLEIGVHIADVTYYVKEGTTLDREAARRGTSVYLVGKVVPMLPRRLSNDLCSLVPREVRPAFSAVFHFSKTGTIKNVWIGETIIFSDRRFTYEEAQEILDNSKGPYLQELTQVREVARKLRKKRMEKGSIAFKTTDIKIILNDKKEPVNIVPKDSIETHHLIEEFALLANQVFAKEISKGKAKMPFIYRVHDEPNAEKIAAFTELTKRIGYTFDTKKKGLAGAFNDVIAKTRNTPHEALIQTTAIRTMEQATYTTTCKKHFGLAFKPYAHCTSPIRRYPDVFNHRMLKKYLREETPTKGDFEAVARHASAKERVAVTTERASQKYNQVVFLKKHIGKRFKGIISGVTEWSIYVELIENKCEGRVHISEIIGDHYMYDSRRVALVGRRKKRVYQLGTPVQIMVKKCDLRRKTIDFSLVNA